MIVWPFHGNTNQQFKLDKNGLISAVNSELVLDVEGGCEKGRRVIQYGAHGGPNQRWRLHKDGTIRLEGYDLCLDIKGGSRVSSFIN